MSLTLLVFSGVTHLEATTVCHTSSPSSLVRMCLSQLATILPGWLGIYLQAIHLKKAPHRHCPIQDAEPSAHNAAKAPEVACNCCTWWLGDSMTASSLGDYLSFLAQKKPIFHGANELLVSGKVHPKSVKKLYEGSMNHHSEVWEFFIKRHCPPSKPCTSNNSCPRTPPDCGWPQATQLPSTRKAVKAALVAW